MAPLGDVVLGLKPLADPPATPVDVLVRATNTIDGTRSNQTFNVDWQEPDPLTGQAVYRLVNPDIDGGRNLLTTNIEEISIIDDFGWRLEGPAYIAPGDGNQELYRFFVPSDNRHGNNSSDGRGRRGASIRLAWQRWQAKQRQWHCFCSRYQLPWRQHLAWWPQMLITFARYARRC